MTQTTTDYLFQLTPLADRSLSAASSSGSAGAFDDHLSQASSIGGDESRTIGGAPKADPQAYDELDSNRGSYEDRVPDTRPSEPVASTDNSATDTTSSSELDGPTGAVNDEEAPTDGDHDTDKLEETVVGMPAAGEGACDPQQHGFKLAIGPTTTFPAAAKVKPENVKAANATNDGAESPESAAQRAAQAAKLVAVEDAAVETASELSAAIDGAESPHKSVAEVSQSKEKSTTEGRSKSKSTAVAKNDEAAHDKLQAALDDATAKARDSARQLPQQAQANSQSSVATKDSATSDADESSDDDRRDSRNDSRVSNAGTVNKAVAALTIGATIATDTTVNAQSKSDENEKATKPVAAKVDSAAAAFARLTRSNSGANRSGGAASADDGPRVDPARFVGRVAKAFQTAQDRGGTLQLRLSPPELGSLRLELSVKDGVMSASLQTENANARRLLLDHLPALRDRLAEQNIRVDRFDVDVRREGTGGQADTRGSQQEQFQHQPEQPPSRRHTAPQPQQRQAVPQEIVRQAPNVSDAGLNLIV